MEERKDLLNGLEIQSYGNLIEPSQEAETMEDAATETSAPGIMDPETEKAGKDSEQVSDNRAGAPMEETPTAGAALDIESGAVTQRQQPRRRSVISIDGGRSELTVEAKNRQNLIDLSESMRSGRILTGIVAGIEQPDSNVPLSYAVLYYGAYKVIIPASEMFDTLAEENDGYRNATVSRRLGAEIDYVVKGVDPEAKIAAGSRIAAMRQRRREYYMMTDRNGYHRLETGDLAEARIVSVLRSGAFVELFGVEQFIPTSELSHLRWSDAASHLSVGQRLLVKITELIRTGRDTVQLQLSAKQAGENQLRVAMERFRIGSLYVGEVTMISPTGIFVAFDGEVSCLCQFPRRQRPVIGANVTVKILGADLERLRIWGVIIHV